MTPARCARWLLAIRRAERETSRVKWKRGVRANRDYGSVIQSCESESLYNDRNCQPSLRGLLMIGEVRRLAPRGRG